MKIFITGGSGFIGSKLVDKLLSMKQHEITLLTRKTISKKTEGLEFVNGDLSKPEDIPENFLASCDIIFNCAGEIKDKEKIFLINTEGTKFLVQSACDQVNKTGKSIRFVQLSSVGAYGPPSFPSEERFVTEETKENPVGEYEISKTKADDIVRLASLGCKGFTYTILRPSIVFGPGMKSNSLHQLINRIKKGYFFYIGGRKTVSTYVHVDDVVDALIQCAFSETAENQVFNLSNDCYLSQLVDVVSDKKTFLEVPEFLVRFGAKALSFLPKFPLTNSRIDSLVSRTRYPSDKIDKILQFRPSRDVPESMLKLNE